MRLPSRLLQEAARVVRQQSPLTWSTSRVQPDRGETATRTATEQSARAAPAVQSVRPTGASGVVASVDPEREESVCRRADHGAVEGLKIKNAGTTQWAAPRDGLLLS